MATQLPPDDDPRFDKWVRDIGPMQEIDDRPKPPPVLAAAAALIAATLGLGIALGFALALALDAVSILIALVLIVTGTVLATCALGYLVWRAV